MTTGTDRRVPDGRAPTSLGTLASDAAPLFRGPRPPALVCPHCDATIREVYQNPLLVALARLGRYAGDTSGGLAACERCEARYEDRVALRASRATDVLDLPASLHDATLTFLEGKRGAGVALATAADWLADPDHDLYLFGPTGVGKSGLAAALAREAFARGIFRGAAVVFVDARTLIRRLKAAMGNDGRQAEALGRVETYERAGLLVLDDLGAEYGTDYTRATIEGLYAARLDRGRPTIITSNLPIAMSRDERAKPVEARRYRTTLGDFLQDDRMVSRIAGNAAIVELLGEDLRLAGWQARRRR